MIVTIFHKSGNVGKTTIYQSFTNFLNAKGHEIEGVNSGDEKNSESVIKANRFKKLAEEISMLPPDQNVTLDIGSSNFEQMIKHFDELEDLTQSIDYWIVPVIKSEKVFIDTIDVVSRLIGLAVEPSKIVIVLNMVDDIELVESDFEPIFALREHGVFIADQVILKSDVYDKLKTSRQSLTRLIATPFDFQAQKRKALAIGDKDLIKSLGEQYITIQSGKRALSNLKAVFESTPLAAAMNESSLEV